MSGCGCGGAGGGAPLVGVSPALGTVYGQDPAQVIGGPFYVPPGATVPLAQELEASAQVLEGAPFPWWLVFLVVGAALTFGGKPVR